MALTGSQTSKGNQVPINIVGSSVFGRYPKISVERTYNLYESDGWMINYPGYRVRNDFIAGDEGRGLFHSIRGDFLIVVIDDIVYKVTRSLVATEVGKLNTRTGEVFIDENLSSQICIVDGRNAWIYNYVTNDFAEQVLNVGGFDLIPGYVSYHNSFFLIAPAINEPNNTNAWYAFARATDDTISHVTESTFPLQTKPDICLAVVRLPGKANHVIVIGTSVAEVWTNVGDLQNYRRNSSFNIDSGCVSRSTIAANEQFVCWLSQNESNSPTLIVTDGASFQNISTDGIDYLFQTIEHPEQSTAFFFKIDGHLFYQLTFFNPEDNISIIYDFKTKKFYDVTDSKRDFHPARQVSYFDGRLVFTSLNNGALYDMSSEYLNAIDDIDDEVGESIPRIRVTNTLRIPDGRPFRVNRIGFIMEQGVNDYPKGDSGRFVCIGDMLTEDGEQMLTEDGNIMLLEGGFCRQDGPPRPRVDLSISKNGNRSFGTYVDRELNPYGVYRNIIEWYRLGYCNEITFQFRFQGLERFIISSAILEVY